jgi:hypothetical protein
MEYKEKIKYLDLVFENIDNSEMFTIYSILSNKTDLQRKKLLDIELSLISFGEKNDLFELLNTKNTSTRWLKLTQKGEKLKLFKKGFIKFEKKNEPKKYSVYKIASFILTFVLGCSTFYFARANYDLRLQESKVPSLKLKVDSLKNELNHLNKKLFENKVNQISDTLETKKESV